MAADRFVPIRRRWGDQARTRAPLDHFERNFTRLRPIPEHGAAWRCQLHWLWIRPSMWDRSIELGVHDRWVVTSRPAWRTEHWLAEGLQRVPEENLWRSLRAALAPVRNEDVPKLWRRLFVYSCSPPPSSVHELARELTYAAHGSVPRIIVFERLIERGARFEPPVWKPVPMPPRTQTDHYVVVHAQDSQQRPVPGLRIEVLIADGEIRPAQTGSDGVARLERIQAGRVVIRVLGIDGAHWRPLDDPPSQASGERAGLRWHVVRQGDCLGRIAHQYGVAEWKEIWDHPKNEGLRARRKNPHVLLPGDQVAVPGVRIHELTRPTDATHHIQVDAEAETTLRLRLVDRSLEPFDGLQYELHYRYGAEAVKRPGRAPTDGDGWLEETVPLLARDMVVHLLRPPVSFPIAPGHLDPVRDERSQESHPSGIAQRLAALGYLTGAAGDSPDAHARSALCAFQAHQLGRTAPSGEPDDETLSALTRIYGV